GLYSENTLHTGQATFPSSPFSKYFPSWLQSYKARLTPLQSFLQLVNAFFPGRFYDQRSKVLHLLADAFRIIGEYFLYLGTGFQLQFRHGLLVYWFDRLRPTVYYACPTSLKVI